MPRALAQRGEAVERGLAERMATAREQLSRLYQLDESQRVAWIDAQNWREDGALLGEALLDDAERRPLADRLEAARLAARVSALATVPAVETLFHARIDDNLGRAGLLEVRALRRRGELAAARRRFAELDSLLDSGDAPLRFWLTLEADRCLTAGLLARDEGRLEASANILRRAERLLRVAGSEEEDAEVLAAQVRTDLARGDAARAVDRFVGGPEFESRERRLELAFLLVAAALRTGSPLLARHAQVGLAAELGPRPQGDTLDRLQIFEAAVELAESQPSNALERLAGPAARRRAAGSLEDSLRAAIVAARAELARGNPEGATVRLAAGVLDQFTDLPASPAVRAALARVRARATAGEPTEELLDRLDLWLILVVDSPGVEWT